MVDLMDLALAIVESAGRPEVFNTPVRLIAGSTALRPLLDASCEEERWLTISFCVQAQRREEQQACPSSTTTPHSWKAYVRSSSLALDAS
jgi:hypothetical protein